MMGLGPQLELAESIKLEILHWRRINKENDTKNKERKTEKWNNMIGYSRGIKMRNGTKRQKQYLFLLY